jgi:hypothetical protein
VLGGERRRHGPNDGTTLDAAALPAIIDGLRARGYGFVTLGALTG